MGQGRQTTTVCPEAGRHWSTSLHPHSPTATRMPRQAAAAAHLHRGHRQRAERSQAQQARVGVAQRLGPVASAAQGEEAATEGPPMAFRRRGADMEVWAMARMPK